MEFCRKFGKRTENPSYKRNYYGLACTKPKLINELSNYEFKFSPILDFEPKNYFHCDIYDNFYYEPKLGAANPAEINYRIEKIKEKWRVNEDKNDNSIHDDVVSL